MDQQLPRMQSMPGNKPESASAQLNRRNVLLATALVAEASLLAPAQATCTEAAARPADPREPQYRETAHVRRFYDLSRF